MIYFCLISLLIISDNIWVSGLLTLVVHTLLTRYWGVILLKTQTLANFLLNSLWLFLVEIHFAYDSCKNTQYCSVNSSISYTSKFVLHWVTHQYHKGDHLLLLLLITHEGNLCSLSLTNQTNATIVVITHTSGYWNDTQHAVWCIIYIS